MNPEDFVRALVALFVIIDPLGNLVVFHVLTERFTRRERAQTIAVAMVASAVMLVAFSAGGTGALALLGISDASFRVAAGLLLLPTVYNLVVQGELPHTHDGAVLDPLQMGLVPLAVPLLAGPGALAAVVTYSTSLGRVTTIAATLCVLLLCTAGFAMSSWLFSLAGGAAMRLAARLIGLVVFAIATEFVLSGAVAALHVAG